MLLGLPLNIETLRSFELLLDLLWYMAEIMHLHIVMFIARKTVRDTFEDPEVYQSCPLERTSLIQFLGSITRWPWLRPCKWGIRKDASLSTAYVLVKQSKQFKAARPIIDYKRFIFAKLFRATAIVLDLLQEECLPQSYGLKTFPQWYRA